jgi:hypothetical protein
MLFLVVRALRSTGTPETRLHPYRELMLVQGYLDVFHQ